MAKFYGKVGFVTTTETDPTNHPGVYVEVPVERYYYGDVIRNTRNRNATDSVNDNIDINNSISILADAYANENFFAIKYIEWMGTLWKVSSIEVQRPRLILSVGGVYNGKQS